jgi:hypothetical protein
MMVMAIYDQVSHSLRAPSGSASSYPLGSERLEETSASVRLEMLSSGKRSRVLRVRERQQQPRLWLPEVPRAS